MLERLLDEIRAGGPGGVADPAMLAARLDVSPPLVQAMLEHLARLGQLTEVTACAQGACHACASSTCTLPARGSARVWVLADAG